MANDYSHMVWVEGLLYDLAHADGDGISKGILLDEAISHHMTLTPGEKADVFVYLLGRVANLSEED